MLFYHRRSHRIRYVDIDIICHAWIPQSNQNAAGCYQFAPNAMQMCAEFGAAGASIALFARHLVPPAGAHTRLSMWDICLCSSWSHTKVGLRELARVCGARDKPSLCVSASADSILLRYYFCLHKFLLLSSLLYPYIVQSHWRAPPLSFIWLHILRK